MLSHAVVTPLSAVIVGFAFDTPLFWFSCTLGQVHHIDVYSCMHCVAYAPLCSSRPLGLSLSDRFDIIYTPIGFRFSSALDHWHFQDLLPAVALSSLFAVRPHRPFWSVVVVGPQLSLRSRYSRSLVCLPCWLAGVLLSFCRRSWRRRPFHSLSETVCHPHLSSCMLPPPATMIDCTGSLPSTEHRGTIAINTLLMV